MLPANHPKEYHYVRRCTKNHSPLYCQPYTHCSETSFLVQKFNFWKNLFFEPILPKENLPLRHFPQEYFSLRHFPLRQFLLGQFPLGHFLFGHFPFGHFSFGHFPLGQFPFGQSPFGYLPNVKFALGTFGTLSHGKLALR